MAMLAIYFLLSVLADPVHCSVPEDEIARQLRLPYEEFDGQSAPHGWRALLGAGCSTSAVSLLGAYERENGQTLPDAERLEIAFHQGQALAISGRDSEAIPHLERALGGEPGEWNLYVKATLAFLKHQPNELQAARDAYAGIAPDSMRLTFLDGMLACQDQPYAIAVHCKL